VTDGYAQIKFNTLSGQLADIGVAPAQIDYLVLSHYHWTISAMPKISPARPGWSIRAIEIRCSAAPHRYAWFNQYSALEHSKTVLLSGDHDVFGDGTVVVLATPGHTRALFLAGAPEEHRTGRAVGTCTTMRRSAT